MMLLLIFLVLGGYLLEGHGSPPISNYNSNSHSNTLPTANPSFNDYDPINEGIKMGFIYGPSSANNDTRPLQSGGCYGLIDNPNFDMRKPTVFYTHGFGDRPMNIFVQGMFQAFQRRGGWNYLFLDWSAITYRPGDVQYYTDVTAPATPALSKQIANTFIHWFSKGLCDKTFHLIGHSLGGEMCGMIGRAVQDQSNGAYKLGRFSALDPAAPLFFPPGQIYPHVSPNDATFVDVYHTDATANGAPIPVGTVDFWLNDPDQIQPGCVLPGSTITAQHGCSHVRAIYLFIESVLASTIYEYFYAIKANSWPDFQNGIVDYSDISVAGMDCPNDAIGNYYLTTANTSHFTNALRGIGYNPPGA